jgi:hypothetical protein
VVFVIPSGELSFRAEPRSGGVEESLASRQRSLYDASRRFLDSLSLARNDTPLLGMTIGKSLVA